MAFTEYDNPSKDFAEGKARQAAATRAQSSGDVHADVPIVQRYVVLDAIFDPHIIDEKKLEYWEHDLGVTNIKYAVAAPRNAIIARRVMNNNASPVEQAMVLYPFFPPQLGLPCNPGEHVWVMFEDPTGTRKDLGYWMCRIVTAGFAEDVNHTHPHRAHDYSFTPGIRDLFEGSDKASYEFRNGVASQQDGERFTVPETATAPGDDNAYKQLMKESDGGKLIHYEPVPRYRKRPSDTVLEGSHNTLIVMGRDRTGPVASYKADPVRGQVPSIPKADVTEDGAGVIDIVAGRGQTRTTGGKPVDNDIGAKELGKSTKEIVPNEGDPDFANDRSRVLVAQKTPVDTNFDLSDFNGEFDISDESDSGDGAIVVKTDKLRFIARSDVEIIVTSFDRDENGAMDSADDTDRWAALVIKSDGNIILRPSADGFVKLGGDDADKAIVCSDAPAVAADGVVSGPPLLTTMGGLVAGSKPGKGDNSGALAPGQGKFAARVLIK